MHLKHHWRGEPYDVYGHMRVVLRPVSHAFKVKWYAMVKVQVHRGLRPMGDS